MELKYELTENDFINFNIIHHKTSKNLKKRLFFLRLIFSILYLSFSIYFASIRDFSLFGIILSSPFFILAILWYTLLPALHYRSIKRVIKKMLKDGKNENILGSKTLKIKNDTLFVESVDSKSEIKISSINNIKETNDYMFIYLSSVTAIIIPKSNTKYENFIAVLKQQNVKILKFDI